MALNPVSSVSSTHLLPKPKNLSLSNLKDPSSEGLLFLKDREKIIGGLVISYAEGRAWFKRKFGFDLNEDRSEDLSIVYCGSHSCAIAITVGFYLMKGQCSENAFAETFVPMYMKFTIAIFSRFNTQPAGI